MHQREESFGGECTKESLGWGGVRMHQRVLGENAPKKVWGRMHQREGGGGGGGQG